MTYKAEEIQVAENFAEWKCVNIQQHKGYRPGREEGDRGRSQGVEVSSGKGLAAGQSGTASTTPEPLPRRGERSFKE